MKAITGLGPFTRLLPLIRLEKTVVSSDVMERRMERSKVKIMGIDWVNILESEVKECGLS